MQLREELLRLRAKYNITARFYEILDFPWELPYRHGRPRLLEDVRGNVLEAGERMDSKQSEQRMLRCCSLSQREQPARRSMRLPRNGKQETPVVINGGVRINMTKN